MKRDKMMEERKARRKDQWDNHRSSMITYLLLRGKNTFAGRFIPVVLDDCEADE